MGRPPTLTRKYPRGNKKVIAVFVSGPNRGSTPQLGTATDDKFDRRRLAEKIRRGYASRLLFPYSRQPPPEMPPGKALSPRGEVAPELRNFGKKRDIADADENKGSKKRNPPAYAP